MGYILNVVFYQITDMNRNGSHQLRFLLSRKECGKLIGLGGQVIAYIRNQSRTDINVGNDTSKDRTVEIKGKFSRVVNAMELVAEELEEKTLRALMMEFCFHKLEKDNVSSLGKI